MNSKLYGHFDNVEYRKELFNILNNYMDEKLRKEFLEWACSNANTPLSKVLKPGKASTWDAHEVYWQIFNLIMIHSCDPNLIITKAVDVAKKGYVS